MISTSRPQRSNSSSTLKNKNYLENNNLGSGFGSSSRRFSTASLPKVEFDKKS